MELILEVSLYALLGVVWYFEGKEEAFKFFTYFCVLYFLVTEYLPRFFLMILGFQYALSAIGITKFLLWGGFDLWLLCYCLLNGYLQRRNK